MAALAGQSMGLKNPNEMYVAMFHSQVVEDAMHQSLSTDERVQKRLPLPGP